MRQSIANYFLFFSFLFLGAQWANAQQYICNGSGEYAADNCADACVVCTLNGYQGSTSGFSSAGATYCSGAVVEANSVWHRFIAGTTNLNLTVTSANCSNGDGIQVALFSDCSSEAIACDAGGTGNVRTLSASLVIGDMYYLMINGANGDVCDYTISAPGNTILTPPPMGAIGQISGPSQTCPGALVAYSVPAVTNAAEYEWTAPPGAIILNSGTNTATLPAPGGNIIEVIFGQTGGQVTVKATQPCSAPTATVTKAVNVAPIAPTNLGTTYIFMDDLPYSWPVDPSFWVFNGPSSTTFQTYLTSYLGCDSIVRQTVVVLPGATGFVYWDMNANNSYTPNVDIPAEGITVNAGNGIQGVTDTDGSYSMSGIVPGTIISLAPGIPYATAISPNTHIFTSSSSATYNFRLTPQRGTAIGYVYVDQNGNGVFDGGDNIVEGASVVSTLGGQAVTNPNGFYAIDDVAYLEQLTVILPSGFAATVPAFHEFKPDGTYYNFGVAIANASGQAWWDVDQSGTVTAGDLPATDIVLKQSNGIAVNTTATGTFGFPIMGPNDSLLVYSAGLTAQPAFYLIDPAQTSGYNFLLQPAGVNNLSVDLTNSTVFRPGFSTNIIVLVKNTDHFAPNVKVGIKFPSFFTVQSSTISPVFASSDSLLLDMGGMSPNATRFATIQVKTAVPTAIGTPVLVKSTLHLAYPDSDLTNNTDQIQTTVVGAYDPNDKQVEPTYLTLSDVAAQTPLEYVIRFQNTGNFPAETVELIDTLSPTLQWNTFKLASFSHPCTWNISPNGVLRVHFAQINLPDSVSNEPESHGFVKFTLLPVGTLGVGDQVENFCDIYFDFNAPIRTNTAKSPVVLFPPGSVPNETPDLSLRPNPASYYLKCSWPVATEMAGTLSLYNLNGVLELEQEVPLGSTQAHVNTAWVPNGSYLLVIQAGTQRYAKRVSIVHVGGGIRRE